MDLATAKAKAAFALAKLNRGALTASDAKDKAAAGFTKRQEDRGLDCLSDLGEAIKRADAEKKPLFILVRMGCHDAPDIRKEFPNAVWVYVGNSFNGNATPRLVVRPADSATGTSFLRKDIGPATPAEIRELLRQTPGRVSAESEVQVWPTIPRRGRSPVADC